MVTMFAAVLGRVFGKDVAFVNNFVHLKIQTGSKQSILLKSFFAKLFVSSDYQRRSHLVGRAHQIAPPLTPGTTAFPSIVVSQWMYYYTFMPVDVTCQKTKLLPYSYVVLSPSWTSDVMGCAEFRIGMNYIFHFSIDELLWLLIGVFFDL